MNTPSLKLLIATPAEPIPRGLGFYQFDEQSLFVQLGGLFDSRRFYSFIDSPITGMDIDRRGRLLFFEINSPRHKWQIADDMITPKVVEPADIRWLDFRKRIESPALVTNRANSILKIQFSDRPARFNYYLADSVILQVDDNSCAVAILVTEIVNDKAGLMIASFRRQLTGRETATSQFLSDEHASLTVS